MCGIIGLITKYPDYNFSIMNNCINELLNRGYDSLGVSIINDSQFIISKVVDKNFLNIYKLNKIKFQNGIGHTRWATHGIVSEINAHPHLDTVLGLFCMVHNGIIENYMDIKLILINNNISLNSETDSEVLLNYIALKYKNNTLENDDEMRIKIAILDALKDIEGTYGIVLQSKNHQDKLFCIRKGSPLLIGTDEFQSILLILSEKQSFPSFISKIIRLNTNELVVCKFTNDTLIKEFIAGESIKNIQDFGLGNFKYFTEKEIYDQINLIPNVTKMYSRLNYNNVKLGGLELIGSDLKKIKNLFIFGCGTSYHSSLILQYYFLKYLKFSNVFAFDASDFDSIYLPTNTNIDDKLNCGLFLSQSGETYDLIVCHSKFKKKYRNAKTLGITNVIDSHLSTITCAGLYTNVGKEKGVASTKSFTSQIISGLIILLWFHQFHFPNKIKERVLFINEFQKLDEILQNIIKVFFNDVQNTILPFIKNFKNMFIMGKNIDFFVAKEGALKIKEIAYLNAEAYSSGALKHGPFALLDNKYLVIFIMTNKDSENEKKIINNIQEILSRKANVLLITDKKVNIQSPFLLVYYIPNNFYSFLLASIVLQIIAYNLSIEQNIDPDFPKNLAKVVTVE